MQNKHTNKNKEGYNYQIQDDFILNDEISNVKNIDLKYWNEQLRNKTPDEIIDWALQLSESRIVTTSFGKYSAVLLSTFYKKDKDINVVWADSGFNLIETYAHAKVLIDRFDLNLNIYVPKESRAFTEFRLGMPSVSDPNHAEFSEVVKLEPFRRALNEQNPDIWFTNIRVRKTEYRNSLDILSYSKDGILKVSPFYYWTDTELDDLLIENNLPKNSTYFDPIKALENRECGIHLQ